MRIHLLQTNDVHSQLENYMRLAAKLRAQREELRKQGEYVFTFDIGDLLDRVRPETEATYGDINAAMMAALGYDAWVFGNNEGLTVPVSRWRKLGRLSQTTLLGSNVRSKNGESLRDFEDHKIFDVAGIRFGIFGVTPAYEKPYELLNVEVGNPFAAAKAQVAELQALDCDFIVALSHLGLWDDKKLAAEVPEINVILGSHSHNFMKSAEWVGNTAVFQPGKHALTYGHTTLNVDEKKRSIVEINARPVTVDLHGPMDAAMHQAYLEYLPISERVLSRSVVNLEQRLPVQLNAESTLANVLVEGLLDHYPADLGLMMAGALNASLCPGDIAWRHVHGACSTPTRPVLMTLSGASIQSILQKSLCPEYFNKEGFGFGFRGSLVGFMAISNAEVDFFVENRRNVIESIRIGGKNLNPDGNYRVVTCEYLWLSSLYEEFKQGSDVHVQVPLVREVLGEALSKPGVLKRARNIHYHLLSL